MTIYPNNQPNCKICDKSFKTNPALGSHISKIHKITSEQYYNIYISKNIGICLECGNPTKFINFIKGYNKACNGKCSSIYGWKKLREDPIRVNKASNSYKNSMLIKWSNHKYKEQVSKNMSISIEEKNKSLTDEKFKEKYKGFLNNMKGKFQPKNPQKYIGDTSNIIFRSSWELKFMSWCDSNDSIINWQSEEFSIIYRDPSRQNTIHRYFPDIFLTTKNSDGLIKKQLVEIKPYISTKEPKKPQRITKRYLKQVVDYIRNQAKWTAAKSWCNDKNAEFVIITEKELFPTTIGKNVSI